MPLRKPAEDDEVVNEAMKSTPEVKVFEHKRLFGILGRTVFLAFEPMKNVKGVGLIIYPGTLIEPSAYAPLAKRMAENGYHAVIATPPLSLASVGDLGRDYADEIIEFGWKDEIQSWVISGHSQGGAIACAYAKKNQGSKLKAVVLLAAYAGGVEILDGKITLLDGDLSDTDYKVTSIYGTLDGIALYEDVVVEGAKKLPPTAKFVKIEGGNHSLFSYAEGIQESDSKGKIDGTPTITIEAQQEIIATTILQVLSEY